MNFDPHGLCPDSYEDAVLLNQRLKAMVAEVEKGRLLSEVRPPRPPRQAASHSSGFSRQSGAACRASGSPRANSLTTGIINRRRFDQRVQQENHGIAARLAERARSGGPGAEERDWPKESSVSINRRVRAQSIERENLGIAHRLQERARSSGPVDRSAEARLPPGWTRGVGGRPMPPPRLRWGPKHDAGDWNS